MKTSDINAFKGKVKDALLKWGGHPDRPTAARKGGGEGYAQEPIR